MSRRVVCFQCLTKIVSDQFAVAIKSFISIDSELFKKFNFLSHHYLNKKECRHSGIQWRRIGKH